MPARGWMSSQCILPLLMLCFYNIHATPMQEAMQLGASLTQIIGNSSYGTQLNQEAGVITKAHDWIVKHDDYFFKESYHNLLDQAYRRVIDQYCKQLNSAYHRDTNSNLYRMLRTYATFNQRQAVNAVKTLIDEHIFKQSYYFCGGTKRVTYPAELLTLLQMADQKTFDITVKKGIEERCDRFLKLAITHPKLMHEHAPAIIGKTLALAQQNPDDMTHFFYLLSTGTMYHQAFENEIAALLPSSIFQSDEGKELAILFHSPSAHLQHVAFAALLEHVANKDNNDDLLCSKINTLLTSEAHAPYKGIHFYEQIFNAFDQSESPVKDVGMQMLIQHLHTQPQASGWSAIKHMAGSFIGIPEDDPVHLAGSILGLYLNLHIAPGKTISIHDAVKAAVTHKRISRNQLHNILIAARQTSFEKHIDPAMLAQLKIDSVEDKSCSMRIRAQLFDELLLGRIRAHQHIRPLEEIIDQCRNTPFKKYAQAMITALNTPYGKAKHFAARERIITLAKRYSHMFIAYPLSILDKYGPLVKVCQQKETSSPHFMYVDPQLTNPTFPSGSLCFGYITHYAQNEDHEPEPCYRLCACNKLTGRPVWAGPMVQRQQPYTITQDNVYCVTDKGTIAIFNRYTGTKEEDSIKFDQGLGTIIQLHAIDQNKLHLVSDSHVAFIDLEKENYRSIPLPHGANLNYASCVGNKMIIPMPYHFLIADSAGTPSFLENRCKQNDWPYMQGNNKFMVYQKLSNNVPLLICLDTQTNKKLWTYPLDGQIHTKLWTPHQSIQISSGDDTLFVLTEKSITALNPHVTQDNLMWQVVTDNKKCPAINSIYLSKDSKALYAASQTTGELFKFNAQTGTKRLIAEPTEECNYNVIDDYADKLYIY